MNDTYEFEIQYGNLEEPLYLTNDKDFICESMNDYMEELGIIVSECTYKVTKLKTKYNDEYRKRVGFYRPKD